MTYPQPPWTLRGYALQTLQLIDIARVRPLIPSELEIIAVWPGKTIGGVFVASYGAGSALEYNELIVVSAITRHASQPGGWISHIYVDNPDSVAGGREIWGLPKELAQFTWGQGDQRCVRVHQGDQLLCSLSYGWQLPGWRPPLAIPSFSTLGSNLLFFEAQSKTQLHLVNAELQVPRESPFSKLGFNQTLVSFYCDQLHLVVGAPKVVGIASAYSSS
ncbi:MAG TPA: acetoacetate decarboxylase family protein [Candidatus Caenarcaniphilales bacterium]